jgi:hypothetical protein
MLFLALWLVGCKRTFRLLTDVKKVEVPLLAVFSAGLCRVKAV